MWSYIIFRVLDTHSNELVFYVNLTVVYALWNSALLTPFRRFHRVNLCLSREICFYFTGMGLWLIYFNSVKTLRQSQPISPHTLTGEMGIEL